MHKKISFWLALVGLFLAVTLVLRLKKPDPVAPPAAPPAPAPYRDTIGARGIIESTDENVRVASPLPGLVTAVPVKVGVKVQPGDLLIQIDDRDTKSLVESQLATLAVQDAKLKTAEINFADRADQLHRTEQLRRDSSSSESELQRARFALQTAEAAVMQARADIDSIKAQIARARVQLEMLSVRAPRAGTVLQVNTRPGEYATPQVIGDPLMMLGSIEKLQLRADVDEANAPRVKPGAKAVAYVKGQRSAPIPLTFVRIEPFIMPKKSLTGESGERVDTRVLQVIFSFEKPEEARVYVGQQMDVFIDGGT